MKAFAPILAVLLALSFTAQAQAGGCHGVAVVQQQAFAVVQPVYAVAQPVYAVQQFAAPVYQQQFVQAQAFAAAPYVMQQQAQAFAQAGGRARAQAIGGGGGRSFAFSRVGAPAPLRNGLAILGAAIAARRSSQVSIAISR